MGYFYCGGFEEKEGALLVSVVAGIVCEPSERNTTEAMIMEVALSLAW